MMGALLVVVLWAVMAVGWIMNIFDVVGMAEANLMTAMFVIRCIGILVFPLGAVLGFF